MFDNATAASIHWVQGEEGDPNLEICIPIVLPQSARPKELTVEVKDLTVLRVSHRNATIVQWRLYEPVAEEVEWRVESEGSLLVVDMVKRSCALWPCLLDLPMGADHKLLRSTAELDAMFREHHPQLPPDPSSDGKGVDPGVIDKVGGRVSKSSPGGVGDEEDLERLLEEAADEVVGDGPAANGSNDDEFIRAELDNCRTEVEEIRKKLSEVVKTLEDGADGEEKQQALKQRAILEEMLRLHYEICEKRRAPSSLSRFIEVAQLDIRKSRVNVGELSEEEKEEYISDEERAMTAHELMAKGLQLFEQQEIQSALHFLRLAALHHNHDQSTIILHSIYSQLNSPRGAFILLRRALQEDNISSVANLKVAEQFDVGARFFLPMFPAALYFYQRAAQAGCTNAMLAIAQLYLRGCTSSTMLSAKQIEKLKDISMYQEWLQCAIDRGSGAANFVKGCAHLKGEHGCAKSYKLAKEYLDRATTAQPNIARKAPHVYVMLEKLRQEEGDASPPGSKVPLSLVRGNPADGRGLSDGNDNGARTTSSIERLNSMTSKPYMQASTGVVGSKNDKRGRGSCAFWEGAVTSGLTLYSLYTLAFPLRLLVLPHIYTLLSHVVDRVPWLAASPPLQF